MDGKLFWGIVAIAVALALVVVAVLRWRNRSSEARHAQLVRRFGPEYDRLVSRGMSPARAERELSNRVARVTRFELHDLTADEQRHFAAEWQRTQARFVDDPAGAVVQADALIHALMKARGYPIARDVDAQLADLSVHHAEAVQHYRAARSLTEGARAGRATTEQLRQAMVHHRALYVDLLSSRTAPVIGDLRSAHS